MATEPQSISVGFSYSWRRSLADYPASTWTLKYSIVNASDRFEITATADGDDHVVAIAATASADYKAGQFKLVGYVEQGSDKHIVYSADLEICPDPLKVSDQRTYAERVLEACELMIEGSASKDQQSLMVDGQTLVRRTVEDLIKLRDRFKREVAKERREAEVASGIRRKSRVQVRLR